MSIKFIHTSDIHIGTSFANVSFGSELGFKRRIEIKETFYKILDRCEQNQIDLLLITGDLFDDEFISISELKDLQKKLQNLKNTKIVISAGNHDAIINSSSCFNMVNWSDNVYIFNKEFENYTIEEFNIDIYSFSWDSKEIRSMSFDNLIIKDKSRTNLLMLHGDIYTKSNYLPININELLEKGFDYIALGHIHKPDLNKKYAYSGSPEPLDFGEIGEHGIIEGIIDDKNIKFEFIPFAKRSFIIKEIEINPDLTFEEIKNLAVAEILNDFKQENMYRLIIKGIKNEETEIDISIIKETIEAKVFYCEIIDETQSNYDIEGIKRNNKGNIIGNFIEYMEEKDMNDPQIKAALYEGLNILLSEKVNG